MVRWLGILIGTLRATVRTHRELALENLALRQQLAVWKVRRPRPRLTAMDRIFWVILSRLWKSWRSSLRVAAGSACRWPAHWPSDGMGARRGSSFKLGRAATPIAR